MGGAARAKTGDVRDEETIKAMTSFFIDIFPENGHERYIGGYHARNFLFGKIFIFLY
jgi:hypothetical protein